jgi:CBS domain containing-hemolysin-like protein
VIGLALAALFIVLNGFFVAAEFALVKVRATQLGPRARRGERSAIIAQQISGRLDRYLSTTQLGITLASLGLGWIGQPALAATLRGPFSHLPLGSERALEIATVAMAFGFLTFTHVLLGELVPKLVAIQRTEQTALFSALPLRIVYLTFQPALWVLERASRLVLRAMGLDPNTSEGAISEEEIIGILVANTARSPRGREKSELVERVLRFSQRTARHAMVPRVDIVYEPASTSVPDAVERFRQHGYSRVLVTKARSLDEVVGYLYVKDLLDREAANAADLTSLKRDVLFVPESKNLVEVLRDMQRKGVLIAVVVDEYGGTSGLVTMEDLLEEIVGEIRDELDEEVPHIEKTKDGWDVDGRATMEEISKATGVMLDDGAEQVGTVVLKRVARLPRVGDRTDLAPDLACEVTALHRRRITKLKLTRKTA